MQRLGQTSIAAKAIEAIGSSPRGNVQAELFPKRVSTRYPGPPNGADIRFMCTTADGGHYYCKDDTSGRPVRVTEWFSTNLANHLGIATAPCAVIEDEDRETYFGSLFSPSTSSSFNAATFLSTPETDELGKPRDWPGRYLSGLYALDLFLDNPDRAFANFVGHQNGSGLQLCAIDFAAAQLGHLSSRHFPIASHPTILVGRFVRERHGFFPDSALEMVDRIEAVPPEIVAGFLTGIPDEWITQTQKEGICETWTSKRIRERIAPLRAGIIDGSLL